MNLTIDAKPKDFFNVLCDCAEKYENRDEADAYFLTVAAPSPLAPSSFAFRLDGCSLHHSVYFRRSQIMERKKVEENSWFRTKEKW